MLYGVVNGPSISRMAVWLQGADLAYANEHLQFTCQLYPGGRPDVDPGPESISMIEMAPTTLTRDHAQSKEIRLEGWSRKHGNVRVKYFLDTRSGTLKTFAGPFYERVLAHIREELKGVEWSSDEAPRPVHAYRVGAGLMVLPAPDTERDYILYGNPTYWTPAETFQKKPSPDQDRDLHIIQYRSRNAKIDSTDFAKLLMPAAIISTIGPQRVTDWDKDY